MPKSSEGQLTMEKTPSYYVTKEVPARIYTMSKDTKLIVVVRDPVTRAISDYTQTRSKKPDIPSFESLTFKNMSAGLIDTTWSAVQIGMYAKHLERWIQYFPMEQLLFVSGERLISDPAGEMARVQDFLGLRRVVTEKHFHFNPAKGFPCLKRPEGNSKPHCLGKTKGRTHPNIDPEVVQRLRDFYKPFNSKFYQMTGHDFGWDWEENYDDRPMLVPCLCFFYNFITLEILLYSICTVFGGCVKSSEVYFMIIYCYDINSLSCLTRFIHDLLHIVLILIRYMNIFPKAQCFYGYYEQGQFFFTRTFFGLHVDNHFSFFYFFQMSPFLNLKLNETQLYKQLVISP